MSLTIITEKLLWEDNGQWNSRILNSYKESALVN